jgi:hypothetical protein
MTDLTRQLGDLKKATASDEMPRCGCCAGYLRLCKLVRATLESFDLAPDEIALAIQQYRERETTYGSPEHEAHA